MMNMGLQSIMLDGAAALGIAMSSDQAAQFELYHDMLTRMNLQMNLTRVPDDVREAADRNYLDSIAVLAHDFPASVSTAIDVGSGAGLPGIPLSIMLPDVRFILMDALSKRVDFLNEVISALHLNAEAVHLRAEDAGRRPEYREAFDLAVARAVAPVNVLCELMLPLVRVGGRALMMKGPNLPSELELGAFAMQTLGARVERVIDLPLPGRDWEHRAAYLVKQTPTPDKYPRRPGLPTKRPL